MFKLNASLYALHPLEHVIEGDKLQLEVNVHQMANLGYPKLGKHFFYIHTFKLYFSYRHSEQSDFSKHII